MPADGKQFENGRGKLLVDLNWRAGGAPGKRVTLNGLTVLKDWGYRR